MRRYFISVLACVLLASCTQAQEQQSEKQNTIFILVRHAEKADDGTKDPPLTASGDARAEALAAILLETKVHALYSTQYKRTLATLGPLALAKNLEIGSYEAFNFEALENLLEKHRGETIVVSGHSNNIPWIVNMLLGEEVLTDFAESDYDNLLIVYAERMGMGRLLHLNYGASTN